MQVIEDRTARRLAMVIGLLDPDIILIGGVLAESDPVFTNIPRNGRVYPHISQCDILVPLRTYIRP